MKKFKSLLIVACLLMFCSSCGNTADVKEIEQIKQDIADIKQQIGSISPGDEFDYTSKTEEKQIKISENLIQKGIKKLTAKILYDDFNITAALSRRF